MVNIFQKIQENTVKISLIKASKYDSIETLLNDVTYETITKNGESYEYVNKIQFKMEAEESKVIKFYKVNASENYTYPLGEGSVPVVAVTTS